MKFRQVLEKIKTYEAGKPIELVVREFGIDPQDIVKLASNENPIGTPPKVQEALQLHASKAHLYPDDSMYALKNALSERFGIASEHIIIGAGSDQVLEFISRALLDETTSVLMSQVTFAMYEIYARQQGAQIVRTPHYTHKSDEFISAYETCKPRIVYICTPNNPTGDATPKEEVLRIIEAVDETQTLVVIDGAYMEYAAAKNPIYAIAPKDLIDYKHVLYLGTFSKAYGLGGMRVGYGIAHPDVIAQLYKMRPPFNITTLSLAAAVAACEDDTFLKQTLTLHFEQLRRYEMFADTMGLEYIESYTNFITYLLPSTVDASAIAQALLQKGVIIRDLSSYGLNALRITIGTPQQNDIFFARFKEVYG